MNSRITNGAVSPQLTSRTRWLVAAACVTAAICGRLEMLRFQDVIDGGEGIVPFLLYWDMETTLPLVVLLLLPIMTWLSRRWRKSKALSSQSAVPANFEVPEPVRPSKAIVDCLLVCCVSIFCSFQIGNHDVTLKTRLATETIRFVELPPAYHDEHSYLLQARTFLQGRLSNPPMTVRPDLFHQFHVLNERRTVSRYFPWTGLWIAPFEYFGHPFWGHWLAGGLAAAFFYLAMIQLTSRTVSLLAGLLIAVSPGLAVFSNLLLAHHPTMLALSIFTCAFIRMMTTTQLRWAFVAGIGLTLAMLGRPMTAAGFGIPFGLWLTAAMFRSPRGEPTAPQRRLAVGFGIPLACGFIFLGVMNHDATNRWTRTAYQEYTDRFTPRHRYGFDNGLESSDVNGPVAIRKYNDWATNLTPERAVKNVWARLQSSLFWSLSSIPILFGSILSGRLLLRGSSVESGANRQADGEGLVAEPSLLRTGLRLFAAAVLCLHLVHIPYWFDGILHWHYVFETAPLLLMLTAVGLADSCHSLRFWVSQRMAVAWVSLLVGVGLLPGWIALPEFGDISKVQAATEEQAFSRSHLAFFDRTMAADFVQKPALVLVDERGADPQLSYIINGPELDAEVIVCRRPDTDREIEELREAFPDRAFYEFDPEQLQFSSLPETSATE